MPKICTEINCTNEAVILEHHWSNGDTCMDCIRGIDREVNAMLSDRRSEPLTIKHFRYCKNGCAERGQFTCTCH